MPSVKTLNNMFCWFGSGTGITEYKTNQISGEIKEKKKDADEAAIIEQTIFNNKIIKNRAQLNEALYKMLNTENIAVYLIFTLVIVVAL
jgi:lipoprotein-releasing system permease protein